MLRIYVSAHCRSCGMARRLAESVQAQRPSLPLEVVDVDTPDADVPRYIIGTPMYTWDDRVLFLGNPSEAELMERIGVLHTKPSRS
jgi:hypothetical protein